MSWRDAWGLGERHGCCGRKLFYCSKLALLNDDDNDEEETFGEYVQSTKQLKKIRRRVEMLIRSIPWKWQPRHFPLNIDGSFYDSFLLWLNRHSLVTHSSNSGAMTQLICHPLSPNILSFRVRGPLLLSSIFTLMTPFPVLRHHFSHGCAIVLTEAACHDSFLTHVWLTLFSMLVEYSGNNIAIASTA